MRTKGLLWVVGVMGLAAACGDDEGTGGFGGSGGSPTTTTSGQTTKSSTGTTSQTTSQMSSSTGLGGGDNESCPGQHVTITPGNEITLTGSTNDAADDFQPFCALGAAPDVVYEVEFTGACSLSVQGTGSNGLDAAVSLRFGECDTRMPADLCSDGPAIVQHQPAGTVAVIVDGLNGTSGDYSVDISCTAPVCGDFVVNPGEECDLGVGNPDDTCSDMCEAEGAEAANDCEDLSGNPIAIPAGLTVLPAAEPWFTNAGAGVTDDHTSTCHGGSTGGKDQVFEFVPSATGNLTIATALDLMGNGVCETFMEPECWYSFLYVRQADCEAGVQLGCTSIDTNTGVNALTIPVVAGQTYYLFVDGLDGEFYSFGPYTLHFNLN